MANFNTQTCIPEAGERGAGMAEYALLLTLVAVLLVGAFTGLKDAIDASLAATAALF